MIYASALGGHFVEEREKIEARYGKLLTYEPLPGARASRIAAYFPSEANVENGQEWERYWSWLLTEVVRLRDAIKPEVDAVVNT